MTVVDAPSLLRDRGYWRWSAGAQLGRLPAAMAPLAFTVLTTAITGSYRFGGVMMSAYVAAELLGALPAGRLLDRLGVARALPLMLCCAAAGLGALAVAAACGAPDPVLLALVLLPGVVSGGLSGGFRSLLTGVIGQHRLPRAIALDMTMVELVLVGGPLLVSLFATAGPVLPLLAMAAAFLGAAALVPRRTERTPAPDAPDVPDATESRATIPVRAMAGWLAGLYAIGHLCATIEVAPLPLVQRLGASAPAAALVPAVLCCASVAGGVLYAWRGHRLRGGPKAQVLLVLGGFVLGGTLVAQSPSWAGLVAGVALVGLGAAPLGTICSVRLQALLPPGRRAQGFSLAFAVQATGFGLGSLTVGLLPLRSAVLLGVAGVVLAGLVFLGASGRRGLSRDAD